MNVGKLYRFVYRSDTQRKDHITVLPYLGEDNASYYLNGRPYVGTQTLPKRWVKSITPAQGKLIIEDRVLK